MDKNPQANAGVPGLVPGPLRLLGATKQLSAVTIEPVLWRPRATTPEPECCNC